MNVERTISARRVEVKPSSSSPSATVTATAPRVVTLHERFSQLPKVEPKRAEVADLNLFQEAGIRSRRQATEQRQSTQREIAVAARRSISTTWTPSFDDDSDNNGAPPRVSVGDRRGRQFEFDQPREPAFIIKGIPSPQPSSRQQRAVMVQHHHQQQTGPSRSFAPAPRGGRSTAARGGRIVAALPPATRGNSNNFNARGGRAGSRGGAVVAANQRRAPVTAVGARGGRGGAAVRGGGGGRGGARGGKPAAAAKKPASKDQLDAEMDSYMLAAPESAKSYLDQQLEDYMHAREQESSASSSSS
jgi:hypothetical protein